MHTTILSATCNLFLILEDGKIRKGMHKSLTSVFLWREKKMGLGQSQMVAAHDVDLKFGPLKS